MAKALSTLETIVAEIGDYSSQCGQGLSRPNYFSGLFYTLWALSKCCSIYVRTDIPPIYLTVPAHLYTSCRLQMNPAKTELLWAGTKHNVSLLGCHAPTLQLGSDIVTPSKHVRVLGVTYTISAGLSLDQHVSKVCAAGFYRLRQLRRIRTSLDKESMATLVHAFVTSRVDYCNAVYAMSP